MAVLGISTSTRLVGLAIISDGVLMEYITHLYKAAWSDMKVEKIIAALARQVRRYAVTRIAISVPHGHYQTQTWKLLIHRIREYFTQFNIPVHEKPPADLHPIYPPNRRKTRRALMVALVGLYPELSRYREKELRNKNKYYIKLFEAVGVARVLLDAER